MKKFLIKLLLFFGIGFLIFSLFIDRYGSYIDYYYVKFTSPKQTSLIIGDSRSFMGIRPDIINEQVVNFEGPMFNYSFTSTNASYGDEYLNSIKRKLDKNTKNGLFILDINPFILAERENDNIEEKLYHESNFPPHNIYFQSLNPNYEYVVKNFSNFHFKSFVRKVSFVHKDGWQEVKNLPNDSISYINSVNSNIKVFKSFSALWKPSRYRFEKLEETIIFLKNHGKVVLVRMPSATALSLIQDKFWGDFDNDVIRLAENNQIKYYNFKDASEKFRVFDGIHLDLNSTKIFTKTLCDSINSN